MSLAHIHPLAGELAPESALVDVDALVAAYYNQRPDPDIADQRVAFGTSGHRGTSFERSFNEWHVAAITQAICDYRRQQGTKGPLFIGSDTHALSAPATRTAVEVLAANNVETMLSSGDEPTPTPAISHAILGWNRHRPAVYGGQADGIVITPSHNPPNAGGFKYNPPTGGPADSAATGWIEKRANALLSAGLEGVRRMPLERALRASTTKRHDYLTNYVADLGAVIDFDPIRAAGLAIGVDPLGGAGVHYWPAIAEKYKINLTVVNPAIDPTFRFMTLDWDGKIRMDPSSRYAMKSLIVLKDRFDIAFACDTDHDRHGIVARSTGLLPANHYLAVMIDYLFLHRDHWRADAAVGKTVVSSAMIDRVAARRGRRIYEVPVGFKWYVGGLLDGSLAFAGEESAGAAFARRDGTPWTTDKDGIVPALLAAEITAKTGRDPGEAYRGLESALGACAFDRVDRPATPEQKRQLSQLSPSQVKSTMLAGEPIESMLVVAPGNGGAIGGLKVVAANAWFAARPSGTENIYKVYAESFRGVEHLSQVIDEAERIALEALP